MIIYNDLIFNSDNSLSKNLINLFMKRDQLIILEYGKEPFYITIGSPHQVPYGYSNMCEKSPNPRKGDTNSGILSLGVFKSLSELNISCRLVIKSRTTGVDPNKSLLTNYSKEIFKKESKMLFEVHGSDNKSQLPLEFSAGGNTLSKITKIGLYFYEEMREFQKRNKIRWIYAFGMQEIPKKKDAIFFLSSGSIRSGDLNLPALNTPTLIEALDFDMKALHLECKPKFRFNSLEINKLTNEGYLLSKIISNSMYKYFINSNFKD